MQKPQKQQEKQFLRRFIMTIKDKLKSYNFWITLVSAIILLLQVFGEKFNFKVDSTFIIDVTTALCSIFVVLGIISVPKQKTTKTDIRIVEPNYDEMSNQISTLLSEKLSLLNQTKTEIKQDINNSVNQAQLSNSDNSEKSGNPEHLVHATFEEENTLAGEDFIVNQTATPAEQLDFETADKTNTQNIEVDQEKLLQDAYNSATQQLQ